MLKASLPCVCGCDGNATVYLHGNRRITIQCDDTGMAINADRYPQIGQAIELFVKQCGELMQVWVPNRPRPSSKPPEEGRPEAIPVNKSA